MWDATVSAEPVQYRLDPQAGVDGEPVGSSSRAGLAAFLRFVHQVGLERVLRDQRFKDNLILSAGDSIHLPGFVPVVRVEGAVNAPTTVAWSVG